MLSLVCAYVCACAYAYREIVAAGVLVIKFIRIQGQNLSFQNFKSGLYFSVNEPDLAAGLSSWFKIRPGL